MTPDAPLTAAPAFSPESRNQNLNRLRSETLDVLILGGGVNGAGVARDLMLRAREGGRPLRVAVVDQNHFCAGTSSKNSQLIHGGLRYLKNMEFRLVREALHERATLLKIAPHLVEPQPFLLPMYKWYEPWFYGAGLQLYDFLAGEKNVARHRRVPVAQVTATEPGLERDGLVSSSIFYDCRIHSARFVLENIYDAARLGAAAINYTRIGGLEREGEGYRALAEDRITGETFPVRARRVVSTLGSWDDATELRLVRGSHLVYPRLNKSENAIAYFEPSGRIIFVIPWGSLGQHSLVGTTDCDHSGGPDSVRISQEETEYLHAIVTRLFPQAAGMRPVASYSSLRPLVKDQSDSPTKTSREHRIWRSADGVVRVSGGKYTTYRVMSEEAATMVLSDIAPDLQALHPTANIPLGGNSPENFARQMAGREAMARESRLAAREAEAILKDFGAMADEIFRMLPDAGASESRMLSARLQFAARHEMILSLTDFLTITSYHGYEKAWTEAELASASAELGGYLGWNASKIQAEAEAAARALFVPRVTASAAAPAA